MSDKMDSSPNIWDLAHTGNMQELVRLIEEDGTRITKSDQVFCVALYVLFYA